MIYTKLCDDIQDRYDKLRLSIYDILIESQPIREQLFAEWLIRKGLLEYG